MELKEYDLHLEFSPGARQLSVWALGGIKKYECECRNDTTEHNGFGHNSPAPPGTYLLGAPVIKNTVPFGPFFVPMLDWEECHEMAAHGRSGIGIHGGGSGLPNPLAPEQGFQVTHGCLRVENIDLWRLVDLIRHSQGMGGRCYITVESPPPATGPGPLVEPDWDSILDPNE